MKRHLSVSLFVASAVLWAGVSARALDPALSCEASKLKTAGKYDLCRLNEQAKAAKTLSQPDFAKCDVKFSDKWAAAETRAMGQCPSAGDEAAIQTFITQHTDDVALALAGGPLPDCSGDLVTCNSGLATCNSSLTATTASLTTCNGTLSMCSGDLATCNTSLTSTSGSLTACNGSLNTCNTNLTVALACGNNAIDGGEQCDQGELNSATCATQGFVGGALRCGSGCAFDLSSCWNVRFTDNADGTITDNKTHLVWEKKIAMNEIAVACRFPADCPDPHDADNTYALVWYGGPPYQSVFTLFVDVLNDVAGGGATCFAGHCDWRLPTRLELETIVDFTEQSQPRTFAVFKSATCRSVCLDCSCTYAGGYWTSTGQSDMESYEVLFSNGSALGVVKNTLLRVRAVRGGS